MKRLLYLLVFFALSTSLSSCGSSVWTKTDNDGYVKPGFGLGFTDIHEHDDFRLKQERSKTLNILEAQIRQAVINKDENELQILMARKKRLTDSAFSFGDKYVSVRLVNYYDEPIVVEDGVFKGVALEPGERTAYTRAVPIGSYTFRLSSTDSYGRYRTVPIQRVVSKDTKVIKIIKKRYW